MSLYGRIWILWKAHILDIRRLQASDQFIHYGVYDINGNWLYWLTFVYAHNQLERRRKLWIDIEMLAGGIQGPWIIIGDYNNVLHVTD